MTIRKHNLIYHNYPDSEFTWTTETHLSRWNLSQSLLHMAKTTDNNESCFHDWPEILGNWNTLVCEILCAITREQTFLKFIQWNHTIIIKYPGALNGEKGIPHVKLQNIIFPLYIFIFLLLTGIQPLSHEGCHPIKKNLHWLVRRIDWFNLNEFSYEWKSYFWKNKNNPCSLYF